jgi:hypothetical protein
MRAGVAGCYVRASCRSTPARRHEALVTAREASLTLACMRALDRLAPLVFALAAAVAIAPGARAGEPAVARARFQSHGTDRTGGTVFFLERPTASGGAVAVGAAHSVDLGQLAASTEVIFELGTTKHRVGRANRLLTAPGIAFSSPGGSLRDDFIVFALDAPPQEIRVLRAGKPAHHGERVQLLGIPAAIPRDEDDIFGTVRVADETRLEVELDVAYDLRGWGGAPIISHDDGRVLGVLEAAWPSGETLRVAAAPIDSVVAALGSPLEGGNGRAFASFAPAVAPPAQSASSGVPAPLPPGKSASSGIPAPLPPVQRDDLGHPASGAAGAARSEAPPSEVNSRATAQQPGSQPQSTSHATAQQPPQTASAAAPAKPLVSAQELGIENRQIFVEIEYPEPEAILGDPVGAFVAGRALAPRGEFRHIDVCFVIDTSGSTVDPSGADINGNGVIGKPVMGSVGSLFGLGDTDPGDSVLAAEVASARHFLVRLDPRSTRVCLITFSGEQPGGGLLAGPVASAVTEVALTTDYKDVQRALDRVLERGPRGATDMAGGVYQAIIELKGFRGAFSQADPKSEKVAVFLTDGVPTLPCPPMEEQCNIQAVFRMGQRAKRAGIRFFTFGIGEEALSGPLSIVGLAEETGGLFTPVRNPGSLADVVEHVDFANIKELAVRNLTNGEPASATSTNPDGSWSALVPLKPGKNDIEATARTEEGKQVSARVRVNYAPGAQDPPVPAALLASRNRVLEERLVELRRARVEIEQKKADETRQQLAAEIEAERSKAKERAEQQRKALNIRVEDETTEEPETSAPAKAPASAKKPAPAVQPPTSP